MEDKRQIKIGIISAPDYAARLADKTLKNLKRQFEQYIDQQIDWQIEQIIDPLTGAAEASQEILYSAASIKHKNEWDYAICLTDLPVFHDKDIVGADISFHYQVAQISIPAFGFFPIKKRIKKVIIQLVSDLYYHDQSNQTKMYQRQNKDQHSDSSINHFLKRTFPLMSIKREDNPNIHFTSRLDFIKSEFHEHKNEDETDSTEVNDNNINVRYLVFPRLLAKMNLIFGMTMANNPVKIMTSFKNVTTVAFTTGAFAMIFPTIWNLAQIFSVYRLSAIMLAAIVGLIMWLIIAHNLWERPSTRNEPIIRRLYNSVTITTLTIDVLVYYIVLFMLFFMTSAIIIPIGFLEAKISDNIEVGHPLFQYMRVAWATASITTIVSAIGAGLENEELVKDITYGYRQKRRYKETEKYQSDDNQSS